MDTNDLSVLNTGRKFLKYREKITAKKSFAVFTLVRTNFMKKYSQQRKPGTIFDIHVQFIIQYRLELAAIS